MSGLLAFVLLVTGMGVGTLICGLVPLSLPLSHRMMRILEVFGAGLLVGAAVTVVIPEGANALFAHVTPPASQSAISSSAHAPLLATSLQPAYHPVGTSPIVDQHQGEPWAWSFITKRDEPPTGDHDHDHDHDHDKDSHDADKNTFTAADAGHRLGSSILFGIVLMYVIDQFTSGSGSSTEAHDGSTHTHGGHHHHDYTATPQRPRLEAHRLSKSFHHKTEGGGGGGARPLHKMSSKASFAIFDRADHGVAEDDEEAQIGSASAPDASTHDDAHRRVDSIVTTSSSSDTDLPEDYDHHDASLYQNADFKRFNGSSTNVADLESPSAGAPLLRRQDTATSVASGARPRSKRSRSVSSVRSVHASFGQALTTIVGLLIHATADGIAMGASAQSGDSTLTMVVFIAIMVHKAPAAFGLCAMLMAQRLSRTSIRKAVAVFALAAPVGALLTYALLALFFDVDVAAVPNGLAAQAEGIDGKSIGTALAFSGGTFLFVAFHAVLELAGADADTVVRPGVAGDEEVQILGKYLRIVLLIAGACTPRFLQSLLTGLGVEHHH
ncbi:zinc transporter ZIP9-like [Moesziomyces antarcticus]|uniref:Related to ATX2 - Golgi membrane protein involved in manganese homeostasis n=1 Tax=Pseudozyma antarctica TaxID=84753 RepID=A0A5C3FDK6_PSEA2|nr:zinc transporter ZIP9-like [Moesziomyces antarcticus]GAK61832.1 zinc transporter ZIP9-like [Moesziomyces antarcticus]SPO42350.1 related to ATX2 - Golgi membrane protein involved in manganese homeostasis [Moesziomyces antarcticus]